MTAEMEVTPGGLIVPEMHRQAAKRQERARQLERRRVALELLPTTMTVCAAAEADSVPLDMALRMADELIERTGGHETWERGGA